MPQPAFNGPQIQISGTVGYRHENAKIAGLQDGGFIAVWEQYSVGGTSIQAQFYNTDGTKRGAEFKVNEAIRSLDRDVHRPDVAVLSNGQVMITWEQRLHSLFETDDKSDARMRVYNQDGTAAGAITNAFTGGFSDYAPTVTALTGNGYVVTARGSNGTSESVSAYNGNGAPKGIAFGTGMGSDIAALKNGGWVYANVVQRQFGPDQSGYALEAYILQPTTGADPYEGSKTINVATQFTGNQHQPSIIGLTNGNFAIVWTHDDPATGDGSGSSVKARIFTSNGLAVTDEIVVNTTTANYQIEPVVAALPDGGFVIAFQDGDRHLNQDIRVASFNSSGARTSDDFVVAANTAGQQIDPSIAVLKDGRFVVSWRDVGFSIRAQIFGETASGDGNGNPPPPPPPPSETATGDDGANRFDGTVVRGLIDGRGGRDTVSYEASRDSVTVFLSLPQFNSGDAAGDTYKNIEAFIGSAHHDTMISDEAAHELIGGAGADQLFGYGGADTLRGGTEMDTLLGGEGGDLLEGGSHIDMASYAEAIGGVRASLQGPSSNTGEAAGDTYIAIEGLTGTNFDDELIGNSSDNTLIGGTGHDLLVGGEGDDLLVGGEGNDTLEGGVGADTLDGGAGNNTYDIDSNDTRIGSASAGRDTVKTNLSYRLDAGAQVEVLQAALLAGNIDLAGNEFNNEIIGNIGANFLEGLGGNDRLTGGVGKDTLTGGLGRDVFTFDDRETGASKKKADYITDFSGRQGDRIDLKAIDAVTKTQSDQKFTFIGTSEFTKAGQARFEKAKGATYVYLNTDADQSAEAVIKLKGAIDLSKGWFVL